METTTDVVYSATFEKAEGTITATFQREGAEWRLLNFRVNSPLFTQDFVSIKCPHCHKPCTAEAKFCPNCGKPIAKAEENAKEDKAENQEAE